LRGNLRLANRSSGARAPKAFRDALLSGVTGLLKAGRAQTDSGRRFTRSSLIAHLRERDQDALTTMEKQTAEWCLRWKAGDDVTDDVSEFLAEWLPDSFGVDIGNEDVVNYLAEDEEGAPTDLVDAPTNAYEFKGGTIDVSSVHAVKGETHTATLLLETFFYGYDVHRILSQLKGKLATGRETERVQESLKVAFVACSRPTHMLAIAIHADTVGFRNARKQIADADLSELEELWEVVDLR